MSPRIYNIKSYVVCTEHLQEEHRYAHEFRDKMGQEDLTKYVLAGLLDPEMLEWRHGEIEYELHKRGINEDTPMKSLGCTAEDPQWNSSNVTMEESITTLWNRCPKCRARIELAFDLDD